MASVSLEDVVKKYNDSTVAVDNINLSVHDEELLVLVGPSGSGKSTILRIIAGLENVTEGKVRIGENDVTDKLPQHRDIAMVFQDYALYPNMSIKENIEFGLKMSTEMNKSRREIRVEETADVVDIPELLNKRPLELSGGEKQRVALARAIARDPSVFLMDEPLSSLDANLRRKMRTEIETIQSDLAVTTVYVTHNQTEAMTMGDRIAVINNSKIQQIGRPIECYLKPNNRFVAEFIGEPPINLIPGRIRGRYFQSESLKFELRQNIYDKVASYDHTILGIRPEDVELKRSAVNTRSIECSVRAIERMGAVQYIHLNIEDSDEEITVIADGSDMINEGMNYSATFSQEDAYVFEAESGETIYNRTVEENRQRVIKQK